MAPIQRMTASRPFPHLPNDAVNRAAANQVSILKPRGPQLRLNRLLGTVLQNEQTIPSTLWNLVSLGNREHTFLLFLCEEQEEERTGTLLERFRVLRISV